MATPSIHRMATPLLVVPIAVAGGFALRNLPDAPPAVWLAAGPVVVVLGFVLSRSPLACLALLIAVDVLGLYRHAVDVGPIDVRAIDVFWLALVVWMIVDHQRRGPARPADVGQRQLVVFLAALGLSLLPLLVDAVSGVDVSVIAWLRLVQTFTLVALVPCAVRSSRDAEVLLGVIEIAIAAELVRGIVNALFTGSLGERLAGGNGPNTSGLLAAVLIVLAVHAPVPRAAPARVALAVLGVLGLVMSQSLGATVAVVGALALFGLRSVPTSRARSSALFTPTRVIVLLLVATAFAMTLRSENLPVSDNFGRSTTIHRVILAQAGVELFLEDPVFGVGWQRSPEAVQSKELNEVLRNRFGGDVNPQFLPDQSPTGVHNAYIQIATEAGLIGLLGFVVFLVGCIRGVRAVLRRLAADARRHACARCAVAVLVVIAIWLNDNALFGAQPEIVLAATMLGLVAALGSVRLDRPAGSAGDGHDLTERARPVPE
jgi:O-antigen ligase